MGNVRVTVAYFARARECAGIAEESFELTRPASLKQLLTRVVAVHPAIGEIKQVLRPLVNGAWVSEEVKLANGDRVALLPPVGGG